MDNIKNLSIVSGVVAIFVTYFNAKNNKREKLDIDYFKKLLVPYVAAYKINTNINPVKFIRKSYSRNSIYIPIYVFYLVDKYEKEKLHKVLISDYMSEFPTTSNVFRTTFGKISSIITFVLSFAMIFVISSMLLLTSYLFMDTFTMLIEGRNETVMYQGLALSSISFNIMLIIICMLCTFWFIFFLIHSINSEEDRYKMSMKSINKNIKHKFRDYDKKFGGKGNELKPKYYI